MSDEKIIKILVLHSHQHKIVSHKNYKENNTSIFNVVF